MEFNLVKNFKSHDSHVQTFTSLFWTADQIPIVLPASLAFAHGGALWDGQGNQIATAGCRQVEREL